MPRRNARRSTRQRTALQKRLCRRSVRPGFERLEDRRVLACVPGLVMSDMVFTDPAEPVEFCEETLIASGITLKVGANVPVKIHENVNVRVDGTLMFDNAAKVEIVDGSGGQVSGILVNSTGTLDVADTDFLPIFSSNFSDNTRIGVFSGGTFKAVESRFNWDSIWLADGSLISDGSTAWVERNEFNLPLTVAYTHLQDASHLSENFRFEDVKLFGGSLPTGETLDLDLIGTATSVDLRYVFPSGFTVQDGATMSINQGVSVLIEENQQITVDGTLKFDNASPVYIEDGYGSNVSGILVNGTGTVDIINTDFLRYNTGLQDSTRIAVNAGGTFKAVDSRFAWDAIELGSGSVIADGTTPWIQRNEFNQPITVPYQHLQDANHLANNLRFADINILAGSLPTGETLDLELIGTATSVNLRYVFPSGFTVQDGAMMSINQGVSVLIRENQQFTVDGTLKFDNASPVYIEDGYGSNVSGILVNGTGAVDIINTDFLRYNTGLQDSTRIAVNAGGTFKAVDSRFAWDAIELGSGSVIADGTTPWIQRNEFNQPITVPYQHLQDANHLADNLRFADINILAGSLPTGETLDLELIGTETSVDLRYVFPSGFTVQDGAMMSINQGVSVLIRENQQFTVDGTLRFDNASPVYIEDGYGSNVSGILVNGTGTVDIINTDFLRYNTGLQDSTRIAVNAGGTFKAVDSRFAWDAIELGVGSVIADGTTPWVQRNEFNLPITVPYQHLQDANHLSDNLRFADINIRAGSLPTGETLDLDLIGTATSVDLRYVFPSGFTVQDGAMMSINQGVSVLIRENQQFTVDGTLKFDNSSPVYIEDGYGSNVSGILVNGTGTVDIINTDFLRYNTGLQDSTRIAVNAGGTFKAVDSRFAWDAIELGVGSVIADGTTPWVQRNEFNLPITVPYQHLQDANHLSDNLRFADINIRAGSLPTGETLDLDLIGTATSVDLRYVFPSGFTVQDGAMMSINQGVSVLIRENQQFNVDGTLRFDNAASLVIEDGYGRHTSGIAVSGSGTLDVINTDFTRVNTGAVQDYVRILVRGVFNAEKSLFAWDKIEIDPAATLTLNRNEFHTPLQIDAAARTDIRINDFSNLASNNTGIVLVGDPNAEVDLRYNFWGTTTPEQIDAKILHKADEAARPLAVFMPALPSPRAGFAEVTGTKFNDVNNNGQRDAGEPGLGGVRIYVDIDNDGQYDIGEPFAISSADNPSTTDVDETGNYRIIDLIEGSHVVREVVPIGFQQTFPVAAAVSTTIGFDGNGPESGITLPGVTDFSFAGASFSGGTVLNTGAPELNASGFFAYEVTAEEASVEFDRLIDSARFFFVHAGSTAATATAYGVDGTVLGQVTSQLATTNADPANFVTLDPTDPISRIVFSGGVVDELTFTSTAGDQAHLVHVGEDEVADRIDFGNHQATPTLVVTHFMANHNGFVAHFNRPLDDTDLNLYDGFDQALGAADVVLQGASTGVVRGSLVIDEAGRSVTFVRTGGPLEPDHYTVTLRSAADGFKDDQGELLDGNEDGTAGDQFSRGFVIATPAADDVTIGIPDFARGADQAVNLPGNADSGLPVTLSTGRDVSSVDFELAFDPSLLTLSGFDTDIAGAVAAFHLVSPGLARVTVSSPNEFSAVDGSLVLGRFAASVPASAPYTAKQVLDVRAIEVRDSAPLPALRPTRDDDGMHVAAYVGDHNASGSYTGGDVTLLQRVIVGNGSGFADYKLADPRVIADLNHSGDLSGGDVTLLQRVIIGTPVDVVPAIPSGVTPQAADGPDPLIYIPTDLQASPTTTVATPVMLTVTESDGITLSSVDLVVEFDPDQFDVANFRLGDLIQDSGFSDPAVNVQRPGMIRVTMSTAASTPLLTNGTTGSLLEFDMTVKSDAAYGASPINLRANFVDTISRTSTNATNASVQELLLVPSPTNDANDPVDGAIKVMPGVQKITVNDGTNNRSQITSLTIQFNTILDHGLLSDAFELVNLKSSQSVGVINVSADDDLVPGKTIATLTFAGDSTVARSGSGAYGNSLADGNYQLVIDPQSVSPPGNGDEMTASYLFGNELVDSFFRFYGDTDGDRDVDGQDYGRFGQAFLSQSGDPNYDPFIDSDGDGDVDSQDYGRFGLNFLKRL
ncbi:allantoinase [Stieleria neptunia]|uniref:Allantoinase n=1 Tax=Stieleria neptunia TaxID=2527979 RepID=A0A518HY43_9BACT|nr:cohesin domain-containing protein [Stieleria neptunia]QDV45677.1 allantoinase [Stieleria neptunia]